MSEKKYSITIKEQEVKVGEKDTYLIKTRTDNQEIKFDKKDLKEGDESKDKLKIKYVKKEDKGTESKWKDYDIPVKYNGGFWTEGVKLDKKLDVAGDMKEEVKPSVGFFKSMRWPTYLSIVFIIFAIIGLIWWWVASSNKEDKEEESL